MTGPSATTAAFGALLFVATACYAAPSADARCVVIDGAKTTYLPDGPKDGVTIVVRGDRIESVLRNAKAGEGCRRIDARGMVVTAGLIESFSQLGIVEIPMESATNDTGNDRRQTAPPAAVRASRRTGDAYNPRSSLIPIVRIGGVTSALVVPSGGVIAGQVAAVDLAGASQAEATRHAQVALLANVGGAGRAERLATVRSALTEAWLLRQRKADWERNQARPFSLPATELQALWPVLDRKIPLLVLADRASDIEAVLRLAKEHGVRVIIAGGAEAWLLKAELAAAKVPVIVNPIPVSPGSVDQIHTREDNVVQLQRAGVPVAIATFGTHMSRRLAQVAGNAVRAGLDHGAAIKAITEAPAALFGLTDQGRLQAGKRANIVVWSGDPLELSSRVEHLLIGGDDVPLSSRQTMLRDRYLKLPGTPTAPLPLPRPAGSDG